MPTRASRPTKRRRIGEGSRRYEEEDKEEQYPIENAKVSKDYEEFVDVEDSVFSDSHLSKLTKTDRVLQLVPTRYY